MSGRARSFHEGEDGEPVVGWSDVEDGDPVFEFVAAMDEQVAEPVDSPRLDLDVLTPRQRFVITRAWGLLDGERYSFRQIADAMGTNHANVQQHFDAAMERLRKHAS